MRTQAYGKHSLYHFYTDQPGKKIVTIPEEGVKLYCAELKSAFGLDELVEDFLNLKRGKNRELAEYEFEQEGKPKALGMAGAQAGFIGGVVLILYFPSLSPSPVVFPLSFFILCSLGAYCGYKLPQFAYKKFSEQRYQRKLEQERAKFPHLSLTSGVYALIDAFPLEKNKMVEGK